MAEREASVVVRFVKVTQDALDLMQQAFEAVCETGGKSVWFPVEECLRVTKRDRQLVYVFSSFSGRAFEHVASTGSRIYGPSCILQCVKNGETLPRLPHPVFCKAMEGLVISCTNLPSNLRDQLHQQVNWMMGEASKDFHERVTHLIAGEVGSKKYTVAVSLKKKIMSLEWVSTVWERSQSSIFPERCINSGLVKKTNSSSHVLSFVHGDDSQFDSLRCPPFKGFVVSVSGFDNEERTRIKNLVEQAGGHYSGEMKINECTHLVVTMARGQKYEFARKWKINIVSPRWIDDCVSSGYCLQEHLYAVDKPATKAGDLRSGLTSTPSGESLEVGHTSILSNMSAVSMTTINDTALQRQFSSSSLQTQGSVPKRHNSSSGTLLQGQSKTSKNSVADILDSVDLSGAKAGFFLDGCKIYISGISSAYLERVRRIINLGGGTRFNKINESVSHVVMGEIVDETVQRLQQASFRPQVVSIQWLVDCFRLSQWMPEDQYRCIDLPDMPVVASPRSKRQMRKTSSAEDKREVVPSVVAVPDNRAQNDGPDRNRTLKECNDEMQELLSQYMGTSTSGCTFGESTLMRAAEAGEACARNAENVSMETSNRSRQDEEATMYVPPPNVDEHLEEDDGEEECETTAVGPLFAQMKFRVFGFDSEEEEMLCSLIKEHGGTVLPPTTRTVADFGVVPLFGCSVNVTVGDVVTNAWLQMSIESEQVLPVEENIVYTPLLLVPDTQPLLGCILSISGYSGIERDVLLEVSQTLGGKCQDYFLRRAKGNLLASTHLIVKSAEGSKYDAAKKWNIPAVNKMWLFECARTGRRVDVGKYLIDDFPDESNGVDNCPRQLAVESIAPPAIVGTNKRANDCTSDSPIPAKRSRSIAPVTGSLQPSATDNQVEDDAKQMSKDAADLGAVFKEPPLPSAAGSSVNDSRGSRRTTRSSSVSRADSSASPLSKKNRKLARTGKSSVTDDITAVPESSASVDGTSGPTLDGPVTTKDDAGGALEMDLPGIDSVFAKNQSAEGEKNVDTNSKKPVVTSANTDSFSVLNDFVPTNTKKCELVPKATEGQTPSGSSDKHLVPNASDKNSSEDAARLKKTKTGSTDVCYMGKNEDTELLNKDRCSSLPNPVKEPVAVSESKGIVIYRKTPKNSRVEDLIQGERRMPSTPVGAFPSPAALPETAPEVDTPSKFMGGEAYHPKLNLNGVLSPWLSPVEVAKKQTRVSLPLEEVFAENISIAVKNSMSGWGKEDSFSQKLQDEEYCLRTDAAAGPLKGVVIAVGKKLSKNQSEYNNIAASLGADYRWTYDNSCTHFIFQGRLNDTNKEFRMARDQGKCIVSPHWLAACEEQNCRVDEASFPHTYNPNMSLSITAHKTPARQTRTSARSNTNSVRALEPVAARSSTLPTKAAEPMACSLVEEQPEPSAAKSDEAEKIVVSTVEEKDEDEAYEMTDITLSDEDIAKACGELENQEKSTRESALLDGLKRLNEASKNHGRGKPLTRILSSDKDALNLSDPKPNRSVQDVSGKEETDDKKTASVSKSNTSKVNPMPKMLADLHTQPSQFVEVVWDDPGAREQREMLASDLAKNSESLSPHRSPGHEVQAVENVMDPPANKVVVGFKGKPLPETSTEPRNSAVTSKKQTLRPPEVQKSSNENADKKSEATTVPMVVPSPCRASVADAPVQEMVVNKTRPKPIFIFSGLSAEERDRFAATVEMLGGLALDTANYADDCTHLIIERPTRNEKYLACMATGKWVLHKSYMEACMTAKEFLPEESYEWGGKTTSALWNSLPLQSVKLAEAAHRWRLCLSKTGKRGAIGHGSFENWNVLLLTESRREDGFKRLLEAGGATVLPNKLPLDFSKASHAFIDLSKLKFQIDLEGMVRCGVSCLKPEYIASFLTDDPLPDPAQFHIPEVARFIR